MLWYISAIMSDLSATQHSLTLSRPALGLHLCPAPWLNLLPNYMWPAHPHCCQPCTFLLYISALCQGMSLSIPITLSNSSFRSLVWRELSWQRQALVRKGMPNGGEVTDRRPQEPRLRAKNITKNYPCVTLLEYLSAVMSDLS